MRILLINVYYTNFRGMQGHTVFLIIFGLLIAGTESPNNEENEVNPEEISPIEDLLVSVMWFYYGLDDEVIKEFFTNEKNVVFRKLESIYRIREESSTSSAPMAEGEKTLKLPQEDLHALIYGTLLAFWTAIDFKICYLIFSVYEYHDNEEYETLKQKCGLYFNEMYFVFKEFKKRINGIRFLTINGKELRKLLKKDENETNVVHWVLTLSLDFILDTDTLDKQNPDDYLPGLIDWQRIKTVTKNGKDYKTLFPSVDSVCKYHRIDINVIEDMYHQLYLQVLMQTNSEVRATIFYYLNKKLLQDPDKSRAYLWEIFFKVKYSIKLHMWHMLMDEFTIDSQAGKLHRISKTIEILKKIRQMHYTILHKTFEKYEELTQVADDIIIQNLI